MNRKVMMQFNLKIVSLMMLLLGTILILSCKKKNEPPVMTTTPSGPDSGYAYVLYNFTALASDPEGENITYQFYWDDGDTSDWSNVVPSDSSMTIAKAWDSSGNYLVRARAKDEKDNISFWSHAQSIYIVANNPPATPMSVDGPTNGIVGISYSFSTSTNDEDEDSISYQFDWGNGDTSNWSPFKPGDTLITMNKSWSIPGTYLIRARARDKKNAQSDWSPTHTINIGFNYPPDIPSTITGPSNGYVGFSYYFYTYTHDPNGDSIAYQFDWGDGDTSNWSDFRRSGSSFGSIHTWMLSNTYNIKVRAKDILGAISEWSDPHSIQIDTIDFPSRILNKISVGTNPFDITVLPNGDYLYVTDLTLGNVWVIRTSDYAIVDTVPVGEGPWGITALPNNDYVYVANSGSNTVSVIQSASNSVIATVPVDGYPTNLVVTPDGNYVYVTNNITNNVSVVRTSDNVVIATISVGNGPSGITSLPTGDYVYVTNSVSNNVSVIRTSDNSVIATVPVGEEPINAISTPTGEYIYVINEHSYDISVIRTLDNTVVSTIVFSAVMNDLAILPNGNYIYLSGQEIAIIRAVNNELIGTIPTGNTEGITVSPDGNYVYVASEFGNYISVIGW